jgi:hypothetical protein
MDLGRVFVSQVALGAIGGAGLVPCADRDKLFVSTIDERRATYGN